MTNPLENLINEMMSERMMSEIMEAWHGMTEDERNSILAMFERVFNDNGEDSEEMFAMFHNLSMRYSKTYYFLNTLNTDAPDSRWDDALEELL